MCDRADDKYGGRLPVHVRLILDEFANIGQIPNFDKLIATIRSREISASIILQSQSQLKAIYKDAAEIISDKPENMPILADLHKALLDQHIPEADRVAQALDLYVSGSLNVFNHRTNIDIQNRIVAFDIKELGKQLKKIGMLIVQDQIWGRVTQNRSKGKATWYFCDEFHLLLREEQTAAFSCEIWKRFRKWGGIPTGATQNVKDLLSSPEIENILENSDFICLIRPFFCLFDIRGQLRGGPFLGGKLQPGNRAGGLRHGFPGVLGRFLCLMAVVQPVRPFQYFFRRALRLGGVFLLGLPAGHIDAFAGGLVIQRQAVAGHVLRYLVAGFQWIHVTSPPCGLFRQRPVSISAI